MKLRYRIARYIPRSIFLWMVRVFNRWNNRKLKFKCVACGELMTYGKHLKHKGNCPVAYTKAGRKRELRWLKKERKRAQRRARSNGGARYN